MQSTHSSKQRIHSTIERLALTMMYIGNKVCRCNFENSTIDATVRMRETVHQ